MKSISSAFIYGKLWHIHEVFPCKLWFLAKKKYGFTGSVIFRTKDCIWIFMLIPGLVYICHFIPDFLEDNTNLKKQNLAKVKQSKLNINIEFKGIGKKFLKND